MPIDRSRSTKEKSAIKRSFVSRVSSGSVTPIISGDAMADLLLGGHQRLVEGYANHIEYPLDDRDDHFKMAKFKRINDDLDDWDLKSDYLEFVKQHLYDLGLEDDVDEEVLEEAADEDDAENLTVTEFADRLGYLDFNDREDDPLLVLANLELPVYLTTSPFGFLEAALVRAGKAPRSDFARWHPELDGVPSVLEDDAYDGPSKNEPLVYHLFGLDSRPDSLVLTEDDHLQFLVAVAQGDGSDTNPIHDSVSEALNTNALILLGFGLPSWSFRVLYWGLIRSAKSRSNGVFSLQLEPTMTEKQYLEKYLKSEARLEIFWGDVPKYTRELQRMLKG